MLYCEFGPQELYLVDHFQRLVNNLGVADQEERERERVFLPKAELCFFSHEMKFLFFPKNLPLFLFPRRLSWRQIWRETKKNDVFFFCFPLVFVTPLAKGPKAMECDS